MSKGTGSMSIRGAHGVVDRVRRCGFTLLELALSLLITSVLVAAIGSSIIVASHAIPDGSEVSSETITVGRGLDRMVEELRFARTITENTATAIEFTVADRNGDLTDEVIRYEWSGTSGDPLTRQYNGATAVNVLDQVSSFQLGYETVTYQKTVPPQESSEVKINGHSPATSPDTLSVSSNDMIGQYFAPELVPIESTSWKVTRVQFMAQSRGSATGSSWVQLRHATSSDLPESAVLEQVEMPESALASSYTWYEVAFTNVSGLLPSEGLCLVIEWIGDAHSADVQFDKAAGSGRLVTGDGGTTWTNDPATAMVYNVFGTYTTGETVVDAYALERVEIRLVAGSQRQFTMHALATTLNQPEVSSP